MSTLLRKQIFETNPISTWKDLDLSTCSAEIATNIFAKVLALRQYAAGLSTRSITADTGVTKKELYRALGRCLSLAPDGHIQGFRALTPFLRLAPYRRTSPIVRQTGESSGGCAGALSQLFEQLPGLRDFVEDEFLASARTKNGESRVRYVDLHAKFVHWLKNHGVTEDQWPFNTHNRGEEAIRRYCHSLLQKYPATWIAARAGQLAASRNSIGTGLHKTFMTERPYGAVQFDFHKIDGACTILVKNHFDVEIALPLARWHIGLLLEERYQLIIGCVIALEITPSSDSVLEAIESSLAPIAVGTGSLVAIGAGSKVFPNQMFDVLAKQCFSVLKMDNGWSNTAHDVVDNLIDVVGCAVNFGPVRQWWGRDDIERVFGHLTTSSLQRSPATFGSGVGDTRRRNPNAAAEHFEIRLTDIIAALEAAIRRQNLTRTEALLMASPIAAIESAIANLASLFVPAPLPRDRRATSELVLYKTVFATICGSSKKGERPYIKVGRWRYTNARIAGDYGLIGSEVKVYCSVRDARVARASLLATGEDLGFLVPPRRWTNVLISYRERAMFYRAGANQRRLERAEFEPSWLGRDEPAQFEQYMQEAEQGLEIAQREVAERRPVQTPPGIEDIEQSVEESDPIGKSSGQFALDRIIEIHQIDIVRGQDE